jgi:hypothetical protein
MKIGPCSLMLAITTLVAAGTAGVVQAQPPRGAARPPWAVPRAQAEFAALRGTQAGFRSTYATQAKAYGVHGLNQRRDRLDKVKLGGFLLSVSAFGSLVLGVVTGHPEAGGAVSGISFYSGLGVMAYSGSRGHAAENQLNVAEDLARRSTLEIEWPNLTPTQREIFGEAGWHLASPAR